MVCHLILTSFSVLYLDVKFLQQKYPSDKSWLSILLGNQVFDYRMICPDNHLGSKQISTKLIHGKNHSEEFLLSCRIVQLSTVQSSACIVNDMKNLFLPLS